MPTPDRGDSFHEAETTKSGDHRQRWQRDHDRLLYSSALRRLAGVTQVVSAAEGHVFHNRLTHTLKVAQIGFRLAQKLLDEQKDEANALGGIEPEVVAAAGLAHDLGHPPFGHVAEKELNRLVKEVAPESDGFEGNPQSFRIVTKLARRQPTFSGLNLSRATLNAVLKYPWLYGENPDNTRKWGAYRSEREEFEWARKLGPGERLKSIESELMDWADNIAYAVHDVEDFYRAGLIPLDRLKKDDAEKDRFMVSLIATLHADGEDFPRQELEAAFVDVVGTLFPINEPYSATLNQRAYLRSFTSVLINTFVNAAALRTDRENGKALTVHPRSTAGITVLQHLPWYYVIERPSLASQQHGKKRIIQDLFCAYFDSATDGGDLSIYPPSAREELTHSLNDASEEDRPLLSARSAADIVCAMTDEQAVRMHLRLTGTSLGSVLDPIL